jgi:hypothetical protein
MNLYPCSGCYSRLCEGECFTADPEHEPEEGDSGITLSQFKANHPEEVARIRQWRAEGDAERLTEVHSDPFKGRFAA